MTKPELIAAYVGGRIGRRDFVRGLTALGVSTAAAAAYAQSLTPGAAAAGLGRDRAGLRVRAQASDYGTSEFGNLEQSTQILLRVLSVLLAILGGFSNLKAAPLRLQNGNTLNPDDVDQLNTLHTQLTAHVDALKTLLHDIGGAAQTTTVPKLTYDTATDMLTDLQTALETQVGIFASVIPSVTNNKHAVTTLGSVALVEGRHAAFVNRVLGDPAFPETFQSAATPDQSDKLFADLGA